MVGTDHLDRLRAHAEASEVKVVLVSDPEQLAAVHKPRSTVRLLNVGYSSVDRVGGRWSGMGWWLGRVEVVVA